MATMNLADPELELIDPTPNVHMLFLQFDKVFFWTMLASRAVVRWSKRMYSCAGICSYEGRGGLCDIALSEPLLKLRPRKDLIETLLHEMIHAFLFVTNRDQDRDGHGPNFKAHMHRINKSAGLNISIYHDFHDEVKLYQTHWWRCNGPCQKRRPHFGIVRRSANRAPGPSDYWWNDHKRQCGGTFIKIKEPENKKPPKKTTAKGNTTKKSVNVVDITKYINNSINNTSGPNKGNKPVLKDSNIITSNNIPQPNYNNNFVHNKGAFKPPKSPVPVFTGNGYTINNNNKHISDSRSVTEHVRNIWSNKQLSPAINKAPVKKANTNNVVKKPAGKVEGPPAKMKKIDDYFKANATSMLKDLYGEDITLTQSSNSAKLVAVSAREKLVDCPVCAAKVSSAEINRHLDECLNKEIIEKLSQDAPIVQEVKQPIQNNHHHHHNHDRPSDSLSCDSVVDEVEARINDYDYDDNHDHHIQDHPSKIRIIDIRNQNTPIVQKVTPDPNNHHHHHHHPHHKNGCPASNPPRNNIERNKLRETVGNVQSIPPFKGNLACTNNNIVNLTNQNNVMQDDAANSEVMQNRKRRITDVQEQQDFFTAVQSKLNKVLENQKTKESQGSNTKKPAVNVRKSDSFITKTRGDDLSKVIKTEKNVDSKKPVKEQASDINEIEPVAGTSKDIKLEQACPCCGNVSDKTMEEHLEECLVMLDTSIPEEGASTTYLNNTTIVIDDDEDDIFDESQVFNATGTKTPCPCCMKMVEQAEMNEHLDICLGLA